MIKRAVTKEANIRGYLLEVYRDPEDGSWVAEVPELPGCVAASEDPSALFGLVEDAIDAWIDAARADGRTVPEPRGIEEDYSGRFLLRVSKSLHRKLAVLARRDGVSLNGYCVAALSESVGASASRDWIAGPVVGSPVPTFYGYGAAGGSMISAGLHVIELEAQYKTSGRQALGGGANVGYLTAKYAEQGTR